MDRYEVDEQLNLMREWIYRAYILRPLCQNPEELDERIKEQEVKFYHIGFNKGLILGA